jgi:hypothetical protein
MGVLEQWVLQRNKMLAKGMFPTWTPIASLPELPDDGSYDGRGLNWLFRRIVSRPE